MKPKQIKPSAGKAGWEERAQKVIEGYNILSKKVDRCLVGAGIFNKIDRVYAVENIQKLLVSELARERERNAKENKQRERYIQIELLKIGEKADRIVALTQAAKKVREPDEVK